MVTPRLGWAGLAVKCMADEMGCSGYLGPMARSFDFAQDAFRWAVEWWPAEDKGEVSRLRSMPRTMAPAVWFRDSLLTGY